MKILPSASVLLLIWPSTHNADASFISSSPALHSNHAKAVYYPIRPFSFRDRIFSTSFVTRKSTIWHLYFHDKSNIPGFGSSNGRLRKKKAQKLKKGSKDATAIQATKDVDGPPSNSALIDATSMPEAELDAIPEIGLNGDYLSNQPHSTWYNRYAEYTSNTQLSNYDFVLNDKELIESDPALNLLSSEIGVKEYFTKVYSPATGSTSSSKGGIPISVLLERTFDTIEDIWEHLRRLPYENGWATITPEEEETRKTVVVLGSGWAAHALMKVANCNKLRIIVVSPSNHFVFTPMLASAATGTVEYRSMTEAVRSANGMIEEYIEGKAVGVDVANRKVNIRLNSLLGEFKEGGPPELELEYDHLVVAVGCKVDDKGVPGAKKSLRLKSCDDARRLRTAVGECFEYASRPDVAGPDHAQERMQRATFLIVGGGPTGIELAGELYDLAEDVTRPHKGTYPRLKGSVRVILVHSGSELVPQFEQPLREEALKSLRKKGVDVILNTRVNEVGDGFARLSTKEFDNVTGEVVGWKESKIPAGLSVWCAGTAPVTFVSQLLDQLPESARNIDGRIKVDKWLRPPMQDPALMGSVLILGDAAAVVDGDELLPQTAQVAGQQGAYIARVLSRGYDLEVTPPALPCTPLADCDVFDDPDLTNWLKIRGLDVASKFSFLNLGILAYLGGGEALSQVQVGDFPLFAYSGSVAFILWRSVYLVKQVATKNRILVTFDWFKSFLFGRDMTRF